MNTQRQLAIIVVIGLSLVLTGGCGQPLTRSTPTPEPTPPPEIVTIHVAPDGSGDYATLGEAIEAAPEGSTITLAAGTYRSETPILIDKLELSLGG